MFEAGIAGEFSISWMGSVQYPYVSGCWAGDVGATDALGVRVAILACSQNMCSKEGGGASWVRSQTEQMNGRTALADRESSQWNTVERGEMSGRQVPGC